MSQPTIPPKGALSRTAEIQIDQRLDKVFKYVSGNDNLPDWLKKCGPIHAATGTTVIRGPYNFVGAKRTVHFEDGSTLVEELTEYNPDTYYSYSVTEITSALKNLISEGYGQWWFKQAGSSTQVRWVYSFVPKNFLAKIALSLFLSLFYLKFMKQSLNLLQTQLEQHELTAPTATAL